MQITAYKGHKIIQNGLNSFSIMSPEGLYLCDCTSIRQAKIIISGGK